MTLPASGPLSLSDIQTEFGGSNPISLSEYYAGGGLVPAGTSGTYGAVPSSGALSVQNFYGTSNYIPVYIEDLFSSFLYNGNGGAQTITNGIDLSGKGGLVWTKNRETSFSHRLVDTARGATYQLISNDTLESQQAATGLTSFSSTGYTLGGQSGYNGATYPSFVSWTFREQPKFFDIVTYTGDSTAGRQIAHNLGSAPGCIIVKCTSNLAGWPTWHRDLGDSGSYGRQVFLDTNSIVGAGEVFGTTAQQTSTYWTTGSTANLTLVNRSGYTYVAYLFAHNAGGFGATGVDNVISCASFTTDGSGNATVNLGYEPQWLMVKSSSTASSGGWYMQDNMRGWVSNDPGSNDNKVLYANSADAETGGGFASLTSTGFTFASGGYGPWANATFIYIAVRRGPMKVPTVGTNVFLPQTRTGTGSSVNVTGTAFPVDLVIGNSRASASYGAVGAVVDRLRGKQRQLLTSQTTAQDTTNQSIDSFAVQNGVTVGGSTAYSFNYSGGSYVNWFFGRAPSFFDEVYYIGANQFSGASGFAARSVTHNLTVAPEFMIVKSLSAGGSWFCYFASNGNSSDIFLDDTSAKRTGVVTWNQFTPTSTTFQVNAAAGINTTNATYISYLFATSAGVSKVGSYTGTGALQTVNCGFASGARFVLIKRSDSTGSWYVWDSARGISSGNDPYLLLNTTNNETTGTNYVDTTSVGFQVTAAAPAALNASGGTYLFLAIA